MSRLALAACCLLLGAPARGDKAVSLRINVDGADGSALPCRVHLSDAAGKPQQPPGLPFWRDHFVCSGRAELRLAPGRYRYEVERGPEHQRLRGSLELTEGRDHTLHLQVGRLADLAKEGWYSGDLHVHRPVADIELLMRAEDLHVAPVTWTGGKTEGAPPAAR